MIISLVVLGIIALAGALASLAALVLRDDRAYGFLFLGFLALYVVIRLTAFVLSLKLPCQLCHGPVLHQKRCHMHRDARKFGPFSYRLSTVFDIIGTGTFVCMYCGTPYRLKK